MCGIDLTVKGARVDAALLTTLFSEHAFTGGGDTEADGQPGTSGGDGSYPDLAAILRRRGPDATGTVELGLPGGAVARLTGSVLQLR